MFARFAQNVGAIALVLAAWTIGCFIAQPTVRYATIVLATIEIWLTIFSAAVVFVVAILTIALPIAAPQLRYTLAIAASKVTNSTRVINFLWATLFVGIVLTIVRCVTPPRLRNAVPVLAGKVALRTLRLEVAISLV